LVLEIVSFQCRQIYSLIFLALSPIKFEQMGTRNSIS